MTRSGKKSSPIWWRGHFHRLPESRQKTITLVFQKLEDDGLWLQGYHRDLETSISTDMQGRVVDVAGALSSLKPAPDERGSFSLRICDPNGPWNTGNWKVHFEQNRVSVMATTELPNVEMDIQAFTQAFFGALSGPDAAQTGTASGT